MIYKILLPIVLAFSMLYGHGQAAAQPWAGILDSTRAIDWSSVGIPGGIPNRTSVCATVNASTYGNGSTDATTAIQTALNSCPAGQVLALSAGTFRINRSLTIPSNVTLRGQGANQTILSGHGSDEGVVRLGTNDPSSSAVNITSGATAGSTSIVVSSVAGITVGTYLMIDELNNPTYVTIAGQEGDCTWCDGFYGGTRARGQIVEVTSVNGANIGISPGLYAAYTRTPRAVPFAASAKYAGVEDLQIYANNTGYTASFQMHRCAYCWIRGCEANYTDGDFVQVSWGYRSEILDNYFSNAYTHAPGATDSDVFLIYKTSATLVQNNIIERGHASILLNWGAAGNVIAYNYTLGEFDAEASNFLIGGIGFHGAHPQFNLIEGNVATQFYPDGVWGSSSHGTVFRNWIRGTTTICNPLNGRGPVSCSGANGHLANQAVRAMQIAWPSTYYNFVGNVVGSSEMQSLPRPKVAEIDWPTGSRCYDECDYGWSFGYAGSSDSGTDSHGSMAARTTAFMHGNYNNVDGSLTWTGTIAQTLPASLYLPAKPAWFGSVAWPAIGPDVTGGPGPHGHANKIPAQVCYETVMGGTDGSGSPLAFNASSCYQSRPVAPTALQVQ